MELVPLIDRWTGSETPFDMHAIYRRPGPGITLTTPLPLRRHRQWAAKGYTYVSLATTDDVNRGFRDLKEQGISPSRFEGSYRVDGRFDVEQYLAHAAGADAQALSTLQALVDRDGAEAVEEVMRATQPGWTLPAGIRRGPVAAQTASKAPRGAKD